MSLVDDLKWNSPAGKGGFIYSTRFINNNSISTNYVVAGSANSNDIKIF